MFIPESPREYFHLRILLYLLLAFTIIPIVELVLLFIVVNVTESWLLAIAIILVTGMIGSFLAKRQGWKAWTRIKTMLAQGQLPGREIVEGLLILIAGALLITPGILTDITGFLLLIPKTRGWLADRLVNRFKKKLNITTNFSPLGAGGNMGGQPFSEPRRFGDDVIDVEAEATSEEEQP